MHTWHMDRRLDLEREKSGMAGSYLARWRLFRVQSTQIRIRAPRLSALRGEPSRPPHPGAQG